MNSRNIEASNMRNIGAPGAKEIVIIGRVAGEGAIHVANVRPWMFNGFDQDFDAVEEFTFPVTVE